MADFTLHFALQSFNSSDDAVLDFAFCIFMSSKPDSGFAVLAFNFLKLQPQTAATEVRFSFASVCSWILSL